MYKVSILVSFFNVEDCIERCARSLFAQTYDDLEYVFIDDCSQDRSVSVLMDVARDYPNRTNDIKLIRSSRNRGVATSRNIAIENSSGEFICFVDSDDWLELNAVELLVEKQQSRDADIVYGNALMHASEGVAELKEEDYSDKHEMMVCYSRFTPGYTMVLWRRLIRASLFKYYDIKAIDGLNYSEDKNMLTKVAYYARKVSHLDKIVYHYNRMNEHSLVAAALKKEFPISAHQQEIGNMQAVVDFFRDNNEEEYYSESMKALLRFLRACTNNALSVSSRKGFYTMVNCINHTDSRFWGEIGWDNWKRVLYGNYCYMRIFPKVKRIVKRLIAS